MYSIALFIIVHDNSYQNSSFNHFALNFNGYVSLRYDSWEQYLNLKEVNEKLVEENLALKSQLAQKIIYRPVQPFVVDTTFKHYTWIPAKVIHNSTSQEKNYLILNKGKADGIEPEMAVVSNDGVVGIVHQVTEHFSQVMSVLNLKLPVSCKFKKNQYFGSFLWSGFDYEIGSLNNIPLHLQVNKGDTLITTGYGVFPENIPVGYVVSSEKGKGNFYKIDVQLSNDFRKLYYVYVIKDPHKQERDQLEQNKE